MISKRFATNEPIPADEAARAPVTRRAVLEDLRQMVLAEADHLGLVGPRGIDLDDFLGFKVGDWAVGLIPSLDPEKVDLERYALTGLVNRAYDFAWQVGPRTNRLEFEEHEYFALATYINAAPTFMSNSGSTPMNAGLATALRQTLDAARARVHLDWNFALSIADLALLARMTEPAVRASLSKEGIRTSGGKNDAGFSTVEHAEALRWLEGRRGFVPTEAYVKDDASYLDREVADIFRDQGWEGVIVDATSVSGLAALAQLIKVDPDWLQAVVMGRPAALDIAALERIGRVVARDVPRFVGMAVERMMRAAQHETAVG